MGEIDQSVKYLLQLDAPNMLAFAVPGLQVAEPLPSEIAAIPQLVLDSLFRGTYQEAPCIINLEIQLHGDLNIPRRTYEYSSRVGTQYNLPVLSIVFWLERHGTVPEPLYEQRLGDFAPLTWRYKNVKLFDIPARDIIRAEVIGLLPLVPFMSGADIDAVEEAAQVVKAKAPTQQINDLEAVLALFSARHHGADLTLDLFRRIGMNTEIIEQSPLFQMLTQKVVDQAKIEGKVEGKAEGKAEGLKTGVHDAVLAVLASRFGQLDGDVLNAIDQADEPRLHELVNHVGVDTIAQIRQLLGLLA
jgi:hypothetical protein